MLFAARGIGCDEFVREAGMGGAGVLRVTTIMYERALN